MSSIKLTPQQINDVADAIIGTTHGIEYGLASIGIEEKNAKDLLDPDTLVEFDSKFFTCDVCGWTCDIDEMSGSDGQVCYECEDNE